MSLSTNLEDYILVVENVVSSELCDAILAEYGKSSEWEQAITSDGLHKEIRNCMYISTSEPSVIAKNQEIRKQLDQDLFTSSAKAYTEYSNKFKHCCITNDCGYDLLKYETGGFYTEHVDSFTKRPRTLSCSFALNDDFEGGEFTFFDQRIKYTIPKGAALLFPATYLYPHAVLPITKGTRYSIITWFN